MLDSCAVGIWTLLKVWLAMKLRLRYVKLPQSEMDKAAELLRAASACDKPPATAPPH